jgi:hypothetical protein
MRSLLRAAAMTSPVFTRCLETSRHRVTHNSENSAARISLAQLGYISEAVSSLQFNSVQFSSRSDCEEVSSKKSARSELKTLRVQQCVIAIVTVR